MGNSHKTASDYEVVNTFRQDEWLNKQKKSNFQIWENASRNLRADVYPIRSEIKPVDLDHYQMRYNNSQDIVKVHNLRIDHQSTMCSKSAQAYALVQRIPYRLSDVSQLTNLEALSVLKSTYSGFNTLTTFYGPVQPYEDLICFNEQGRTKVWVNSNLSSNKTVVEKRENTIGNLISINTVYVNKILDLVEQKTKSGTFPEKLKNKFRKGNPKSYFEALNIVQQFAGQQSIEIPTKIRPALRKKLNIDSTPLKQPEYFNSSSNIHLNNQFVRISNPKSPLSGSNIHQGFILASDAQRNNRTPIKGEALENSKYAIRATPIQNYQLISELNGIKQLEQSQKIVVSPQKNLSREIPRPVFHPINLNQRIFINNIPIPFNSQNQSNQISQPFIVNRNPASPPGISVSQYHPNLIQSGHTPVPVPIPVIGGQQITGQRKFLGISPTMNQYNLYHPPPTIVKVQQKTIVVKHESERAQIVTEEQKKVEQNLKEEKVQKQGTERNTNIKVDRESERKLPLLENKGSYQEEYYENMGEEQFEIEKRLEELEERKFFTFQNNFQDARIQRSSSNELQKPQNAESHSYHEDKDKIAEQPQKQNQIVQQFINHQENYFPLAGMFRNNKSQDERKKNFQPVDNQPEYNYQEDQENSAQGDYNQEQFIERQFNEQRRQEHQQYQQQYQQQNQAPYQFSHQHLQLEDIHKQQKQQSPVRIRLEAEQQNKNDFHENRDQSIQNQSGFAPEQNQTNYVQTSHQNLNQNQMSYTSPYQYQFNYQPSLNTNNESRIPQNAKYEDIEEYIRNKYRSYIGSDDNSVAKPYSTVAPYSGYAAQIEKVDVGQMASYVESKYDQFTSQDVEFSFRPGIQFGKTQVLNEEQTRGKTNLGDGYQPFKRIEEYEEEDALSPETEKHQQRNRDQEGKEVENIEGGQQQKQQDILDVKNMERSLDKKYSSIKSNQQIKDLDSIKNEDKLDKQQGFDVKKLEENLIRFEESRVGSGHVNQPISLTSQPRFQTSQVSKIHSIDERLNANRRSSMNKEFTTQDYHSKYIYENKTPTYQYGRKSRASKVTRQIASIEEKYNKYVKSGGAYLNPKQVLKPKQQNYHQYQDYEYENSSSRMVTGNFGYVDNTKYNDNSKPYETRYIDNNKYNDKRQYSEKAGQDEYRRVYQGAGGNSKSNIGYEDRREKASKNSKNVNGLSYEDLRKFMWS